MNKTLFTLAAVIVLAGAAQLQAAPKPSHTNHISAQKTQVNHTSNVNHASVHKTQVIHTSSLNLNRHSSQAHGMKFAHGHLYQGKNHNHWSQCRWDSRYGCNCYFDPYYSCWYYWCQPDCCYYPVSFCPYRTYCNWNTVIVQPNLVANVAVPDAGFGPSSAGTTLLPDNGPALPPQGSTTLPDNSPNNGPALPAPEVQ